LRQIRARGGVAFLLRPHERKLGVGNWRRAANMEWDALILSRIQFGFVIAWHIIFPSLTIGLASYLAVLEGLWLWKKNPVFKTLYLFWVKVFAIAFGMGVVSGVVMSYQLGTNWSVFSKVAMPVIGPLFAFEVLAAFFLEASFLGIMLFGWKRVGPKLHFVATCAVAIGTLISAFWILAANSWMQTPAGFATQPDGTLIATDYLKVIFNPSFPTRFMHMTLAAYLTTAMVVAGGAAFGLLAGKARGENRIALRMAVLMMILVTPVQIMVGHASGEVALHHQPAKVAAMEGWWEPRAGQPTVLVGWPDRAAEKNHFEIALPNMGSLVFGVPPDYVLPGLKQFPKEDRPPVAIVFWAFRIMVGMGLAMLALGVWGAGAWALKKLDQSKWFYRALVLASPSGFVAVLAGWIAAEVGRQPYVIYGILRTRDAVSPITTGEVATSLLIFFITYAIVFSVGALYILRLIVEGPHAEEQPQTAHDRGPNSALAAAPLNESGDPNA